MLGAKEILYGHEAREKFLAGIDKLANAVKVTLGPNGRHVAIDKTFREPRITKDGATVAKDIELADPFENMGAQLLKQVALKTMEEAGDGTTTSIVLAQAFIHVGMKLIDGGANPVQVKRSLEALCERAVTQIKLMSSPIDGKEDLKKIALISSNGDEDISEIVSSLFEKMGKKGTIALETHKKTKTEIFHSEGMEFPRGFLSPAFVTDPARGVCEMHNPYVFLSETLYYHANALGPVIRAYLPLFKQTQRGLFILCHDVKEKCLEYMIHNRLAGHLPICIVSAPYEGQDQKEFLKDVGALTGAKPFDMSKGAILESDFSPEYFGSLDRLLVAPTKTIMIHEKSETLKERAAFLELSLEDSDLTEEARSLLNERLALLTTGIARIKVGGLTEVESLEKKDRLEDAMHAVRGAMEEGYVPGGGVALLSLLKEDSSTFREILFGVDLAAPLYKPYLQIRMNGGEAEQCVDMSRVSVGEGVIDPTKVVRLALENAISIASLILTTEAAITNVDPLTKEMLKPLNQTMTVPL